jgi:diguanylate cyclase (GGDEF)-like protein
MWFMIDSIFGRFIKRETEYRSHCLIRDMRQIMVGMIIWALVFLLHYKNDYSVLGISPEYLWLLMLRIAYFLLVLVITWLVWFQVRTYVVLDRLVLLWAMSSVIATIIVYEVAPRHDPGRFLFDLIVVFSLYLCIPSNLVNRLLPPLLLTVYEMMYLYMNRMYYSEETAGAVLFSFTVINGACIAWSVYWLSTLRRQYVESAEERHMSNELHRLASTDSLTGTNNRRRLLELAGEAFYRYRRYKRPFSLIVMDLDGFKLVNDTFGHQQGDMTLVDFTRMLTAEKRETDALGRIGGDEFCLVLPETSEQEAISMAQRILLHCAEIPINHNQALNLLVTVSIGVAEACYQDLTLDNILSRADAAMYEAKNTGKNRIIVSSHTAIPIMVDVR